MTSALPCPHLEICSGCNPPALSLQQQQQIKIDEFKMLWPGAQPETLTVDNLGSGQIRTRLDLTWSQGHWGLWNKNKSEIINLETCHMVTPELQDFFIRFKEITWPIQKGSCRLRVSPSGNFGVWLDFANTDIKDLFAEKSKLFELSQIAQIEIGQRRKHLTWQEDKWKLQEPKFQKWISSYINDKEISIYSLIGGFSQTGPAASRAIARTLQNFLSGSFLILEFGSGFGTLTLPASADEGRQIYTLEQDLRASQGLQLTLKEHKITNVHCLTGDFQQAKNKIPQLQFDTFIVNPPRSGVGHLFTQIPASVKKLIYMSCYL